MSTIWMKEHFITQRKESKAKHSFFQLYIDGHGDVCVSFISEKHLHTKSHLVSPLFTNTAGRALCTHRWPFPDSYSVLSPAPPTHGPGVKTFRFLPALWQKPRWRRWSLSQICLRWRLASPGQPWLPSPAPQAALAPASRLSTQMTRKTWGSFNVTTVNSPFYWHTLKETLHLN